MTFLIFLIVLGVLIFVHELGHFLVAKKAEVRADEFGFGYPPRALVIGKKWGTLFTLNWIPFGGFVKIAGEDYEETSSPNPPLLAKERRAPPNLESQVNLEGSKNGKLFTQVSKKWQAAILAAGVTFNILFAWLLFSLGFIAGLPAPIENDFGAEVKNPALTITGILPDSPAKKIGLKTGDKIKSISSEDGMVLEELKPENVSDFVNNSFDQVLVRVDRGGEILEFTVIPKTGMEENRKVIGINMDIIGTISLPVHKAFYEGGRATLEITFLTIKGIGNLIADAFRGKADISQITGPVGIIGLVGDASKLGFIYLITFTALISINLAVINFLPFPALDGGRIIFVAIEGITKKKIKSKVAHTLNNVGFALLIVVMLIVTYRDILKLF